MKILRGLWLVLFLGVLAGSSILAHAQDVRGKFTLPSETHWGTAVLPAGDYKFSLDSTSFPARVTVMRVNGGAAAVLLSLASDPSARPRDSSQLKLERHGDEMFVRALYIKDLELELHYAVPKMSSETAARNTARLQAPGDSGASR